MTILPDELQSDWQSEKKHVATWVKSLTERKRREGATRLTGSTRKSAARKVQEEKGHRV